MLEGLGLGFLQQNWLADPAIALWTIFFILTWKYVGFAILLMLAGLQGVPDELAEAAQIDGASWWQIQRHITLPLLAPTIRIWAFLTIIGSLQAFDMIWVTVAPAVRRIATETMATYMVQQGQFAGQPGLRQRHRRHLVRDLADHRTHRSSASRCAAISPAP